jgi:protein SCO1
MKCMPLSTLLAGALLLLMAPIPPVGLASPDIAKPCADCKGPAGAHPHHCGTGAKRPPIAAAAASGGERDFSLHSVGGSINLSSLRGHVVLLYFGYTWCPDICPTNLAMISGALRALNAEELDQVKALFISVDPERDDLKRLAQYAGYFHPGITGATGTPEEIADAAMLYGASYRRVEQPDSAMGYMVDHSADTYVLNRKGELVGKLDHATPSPEILAVVRNLLKPD